MAEKWRQKYPGRGPHRETKGQWDRVLLCGSVEKLPGTVTACAYLPSGLHCREQHCVLAHLRSQRWKE